LLAAPWEGAGRDEVSLTLVARPAGRRKVAGTNIMNEDIVAHAIALLRREGWANERELVELEIRLRQHWGGLRVYVPKLTGQRAKRERERE
jgi:hypothetical protein